MEEAILNAPLRFLLYILRLVMPPALVYKTINSDQLYETRSLILEIHKGLTVEDPLVNKSGKSFASETKGFIKFSLLRSPGG